jgi:hypothetical protein
MSVSFYGPAAALVAAAVLLLGQASAGPNPADAQKITTCLETAGEKDTSGLECIGIVADPCITAALQTNRYLEDSRACAARELAIWNARIASHIESTKRHGKQFVDGIAAAQRSFADSIGKLCPLHDKLDPGMAPGGGQYCRLQETAMRALQLHRIDRASRPH